MEGSKNKILSTNLIKFKFYVSFNTATVIKQKVCSLSFQQHKCILYIACRLKTQDQGLGKVEREMLLLAFHAFLVIIRILWLPTSPNPTSIITWHCVICMLTSQVCQFCKDNSHIWLEATLIHDVPYQTGLYETLPPKPKTNKAKTGRKMGRREGQNQ